jgi:alkylated DNA repair dioxygenase AlkB
MEDTTQVEHAAAGFVVLRSALDAEQQKELARFALTAGSRAERGFWKKGDAEAAGYRLNAAYTRGRIYDAIDAFPDHEGLLSLCHDLVARARRVDPALPAMQPTHLLLLCYTSARGMAWHADAGENDGDNDHPIVSFSIGNRCTFGYEVVAGERKYTTLESGDVAIWGGPQRLMKHCVKKVLSHTSPTFLHDVVAVPSAAAVAGSLSPPLLDMTNVRFNFTFRDAPTVIGREKDFETFQSYAK